VGAKICERASKRLFPFSAQSKSGDVKLLDSKSVSKIAATFCAFGFDHANFYNFPDGEITRLLKGL